MSTSRRLSARALGALSLLLASVLVTGQGAYAASRTMHDTTDDTYVVTDLASTSSPVATDGPKGDITWVRTTHRKKVVGVTVRVRDLPTGLNIAAVVIKTPKHRKPFVLTGIAGYGSKWVTLTKGVDDREVDCDGLRMRFEVRNDVVRGTIPRRCLDNPRWVRTGAVLMVSTDPGDPDSDDQTIDVAGLSTISDEMWQDDSSLPPLGPKVRVG
jgi:hypothetical protein